MPPSCSRMSIPLWMTRPFGLHLQQAVEKAAKALMSRKNIKYPFAHDIDTLCKCYRSKAVRFRGNSPTWTRSPCSPLKRGTKELSRPARSTVRRSSISLATSWRGPTRRGDDDWGRSRKRAGPRALLV